MSPSPTSVANRSSSNFGNWPVPRIDFGIDQQRHVGFLVTVLAGVQVEHELRQRAMQARQLSAQHREARAGQLRRDIAVEPAVAGAEFDVVLDREIEGARRAPAVLFDVVAFRRRPAAPTRSGRFGMPSAIASICARMASSRASLALSSSPKPATSAISAATSSPFALAWPIALLRVLRRFCSSCVRTCSCLRSDSSVSSAATSSSKPRVSRRRAASSAGRVRSSAGSSMVKPVRWER